MGGITGSIIFFVLKSALASVFMTFVLWLALDIPIGKMPLVLISVMACNIIASVISSVLLTQYRGV